jgi:hypothetical protein
MRTSNRRLCWSNIASNRCCDPRSAAGAFAVIRREILVHLLAGNDVRDEGLRSSASAEIAHHSDPRLGSQS